MSRTEIPELVDDKLDRHEKSLQWLHDLEWISEMLIAGEQNKLALLEAGYILKLGRERLTNEN